MPVICNYITDPAPIQPRGRCRNKRACLCSQTACSVKYTQKGGTVKIYEKETLLKSDTVLVIEDNGIGIQSEDLPRIMERGYTGYNGRGASKSSGIGLYLCKKAADQLGIDIEVESEPYHGTKVLLTIRQHHTRHE